MKDKKETKSKKQKKKLKKSPKSKRVYKTKKLWGLEAPTFPRTVRHYMDQDYINKLNDKEKEWLSKFNEEEYGNKLSKKTKRSKTQRKRIYDQTNARNRDLFNVGIKWNNGGTGASKYHHTEDDDSEIVSSEDAVIQELDIKRDIEAGRLIIPNDDD